MYSTMASSMWQRRTNKIIAAAVVIIGLTMMISTIPQCIYAGVIFIVLALGWLGWIRMKEKKAEDELSRTEASRAISPILFIMASQHLPPSRLVGPTLANPNDKPPTYDQVINLDGLPPDYFTVISEKPPRYEDITGTFNSEEKLKSGSASPDTNRTNIPSVHTSGTNNITNSGSRQGTPLTLDVPHLIQDVGLLPSTSYSLASSNATYSNLPSSDVVTTSDIINEEGTKREFEHTNECKSPR